MSATRRLAHAEANPCGQRVRNGAQRPSEAASHQVFSTSSSAKACWSHVPGSLTSSRVFKVAHVAGRAPQVRLTWRKGKQSRPLPGLSARVSEPCCFARRMQDIESDTGYDTRRRVPDGARARVPQTAVYDICGSATPASRRRTAPSRWT